MDAPSRRGFRFRTAFGEVLVVRPSEIVAEDRPNVLRPGLVRGDAAGWIEDPAQRITALALHEELEGLPARGAGAGISARAGERIERALLEGELVALRIPPPHHSGPPLPVPEEPPSEPPPPMAKERTWIEIELLDSDNPPQPVGGVRYQIELPDASIVEGRLDARGRARVTGIDPGTCKITFPDLDQSVVASG